MAKKKEKSHARRVRLSVPVIFTREAQHYVTAYCPALELSTSGRNVEQAQEMFKEALDLFVEDICRRGVVDQVMQELGWKKVHKAWMPPEIIASRHYDVFLPVK
jgi:predicted RNase H-like HicB family nuclease